MLRVPQVGALGTSRGASHPGVGSVLSVGLSLPGWLLLPFPSSHRIHLFLLLLELKRPQGSLPTPEERDSCAGKVEWDGFVEPPMWP